jgi:DNA-binding response OmpR family regulator
LGSMRILVVDDDQRVRDELKSLLSMEGFSVEAASNGKEALSLSRTFSPSLIILDIALADTQSTVGQSLDGIEVLRRLRAESNVCILMLTSTAINYVKVSALRMGADDFLTKPYSPEELLARVTAILRRAQITDSTGEILERGKLRIDPGSRKVWKSDAEITLTPIEFEILHTLAQKPGRVFGRNQLINLAWGHRYLGDERLVDVHIGRLRKKIEGDPAQPSHIITVWGKGYRFEE